MLLLTLQRVGLDCERGDVDDGDLIVPEVHQAEVVLVEESVVPDVTDFVVPQDDGPQAGEERQNAQGANSVSAHVEKFQLESVT